MIGAASSKSRPRWSRSRRASDDRRVTIRFVLDRPQTLANFSLGSPRSRGAPADSSYGYTETIDSWGTPGPAPRGPALRWNIRPSWFFDVNYSRLETTSPAQRIETQGLFANLFINLH